MLKQILKIIAESEVQNQFEIARKAAIPVAMVTPILEQLARQGYLQTVQGGCAPTAQASSCGGCAAAESCDPLRGQCIWMLTEKGQRAISDINMEIRS
jgi:predicted transcriptional regulator